MSYGSCSSLAILHVPQLFTCQAAKDALEKAIEGADVAELENALEEVQKWEDLEEASRFRFFWLLCMGMNTNAIKWMLLNFLHCSRVDDCRSPCSTSEGENTGLESIRSLEAAASIPGCP